MMFPGSAPGPATGTPSRDVQELWFSLARLGWSSLVLVPVDEGFSAASIATSLADVGSRVRDTPVTVIVADAMDYESARILADLQLRIHDDRPSVRNPSPGAMVEVAASAAPPRPANGERHEAGDAPVAEGESMREAQLLPATGQVVIAIQPVVVEPLGVAIAHAADAVVLCIQLRKTRLAAARRTLEIIGADRVAGAFLVG